MYVNDQHEQQVADLQQALMDDGYSEEVAEALAERGVTVAEAQHLSKREVLDYYLAWNGIAGFTDSILDVLDNAEANCNM